MLESQDVLALFRGSLACPWTNCAPASGQKSTGQQIVELRLSVPAAEDIHKTILREAEDIRRNANAERSWNLQP